MCYANDFPDVWSGCDLIVSFSSGVPINKEVVEVIGAATPMGKGKEKKIEQEAVKKTEVEGIEAGHETKKRKTTKSRKATCYFRRARDWTLLQLERRSAILSSQRSE